MPITAFTSRYDGPSRVLQNDVIISTPPINDETTPPSQKYISIWDTGATNSVITKRVVDDLGLKPTGAVEMFNVGGKTICNTYLVEILITSKVLFKNVRVTEGSIMGADVLIGMDIIGVGDFAVSNKNGKTVFSYRHPSCEEIDFIPQVQEQNIMEGGNRQQRRALLAQKRRR